MSSKPLLIPFIHPTLGALKNRIVMAPMTRSFAAIDHQCTPEIANYYERRASDGVGLILTEGIVIHPSGDGYNRVPHLHTEDQMKSGVSFKLADTHEHRLFRLRKDIIQFFTKNNGWVDTDMPITAELYCKKRPYNGLSFEETNTINNESNKS